MKKMLVLFVAITIGLFALQPTHAQKAQGEKAQRGKSQGQPNLSLPDPIRCDDCPPCDNCPPPPECNFPNPIDGAEYFVTQHYHDFLLRGPDSGGLAFWTGQITACGSNSQCIADKRVDVSRAFWECTEFREQSRTFALDNSNPPPQYDNREFVRMCYKIYLQREPNQGEWDYWTNSLDGCTSDPNSNGSNGYHCYQDIIRAFLVSEEYRSRFGCP